jgi:hypothetical protein
MKNKKKTQEPRTAETPGEKTPPSRTEKDRQGDSGVGADGRQGEPAGRESEPKWPGGGTKGENEQTAR